MEPYLRVSLTYGKNSVIAKRFRFHMGPVYSYIGWAQIGLVRGRILGPIVARA